MLDVAAIATTAVSTILLPYIKDGAAKFVETIRAKTDEGVGEYASELAGKVWDKVTSVFSSDSEKVLIEQFKRKPEAAAPLIEETLKEKLEQDDNLRQEMDDLVTSKTPDGQSTGAQIINSSYVAVLDMRHSHNSGSNNTYTGATFNLGDTRAIGIAPPSRPTTPEPQPAPGEPRKKNF